MQQKIMTLYSTSTKTDEIDALIEIYYDKIYKYCFSILRNAHDAEDAVQEVFLKAIKNGQFTTIENQNAWLYKVSYFHCMNKIKRTKLLAFIPFIENQNASIAIASECDEELQYILTRLKPEERALIVLRIVEDYSFEEIALIFEKPASTIRKRFERLKSKIKKIL